MRGSTPIIAFAAGLALTAVVPLSPAAAQSQQQLNWCEGKDGAPPDLIIGGCTAVIQSGKITGKNLAAAFNNRGNAYDDKGQY
ncbi:MAG TPA: hypothetical protein VFA53_03240, partial [Xanthobacteraceae bacterium]|nr:hypothetical protein [Xanthobacteraceae bacterium]